MIGRMSFFFILLSCVSLLLPAPQPLKLVFGFIQVFLLPGLAMSAFVLRSGFGKADRFFLSILISPVVMSLFMMAAAFVTGDVVFSARIVAVVFYLLFFAGIIFGRKHPADTEVESVPRGVLIVSIVFSGLILFSYAFNAFLLVRSDSWYHASVISEILQRGIPPKEPWLADVPIRYMWIYHLFQTAWKELSGLSIFWAMGSFNVITAFVFPYLVARYVSFLGYRKNPAVTASILAVAGLESASWIFWPLKLLRAITGSVKGAEEMQRMFSGIEIKGSDVIHTLTPYGTWMVNTYDKFITITAFSFSLCLFTAALIVVLNRGFLKDSRVRSFILLFILILGTVLFHAIAGMALLMTAMGAGVLVAIFGRYWVREGGMPESRYIVPAAALAAASFSMPYIFSLTAGSGDGGGSLLSQYLHLGLRSILTILLPLLVLSVYAKAALKRLAEERDYRSAVVLSWMIVMAAAAVFINLPTVNESKLIFPLFIVIGPPIYAEMAESIGRRKGLGKWLAIAAISILFAVPPVLTFRGFLIQKPDTEITIRRQEVDEEDLAFFAWIKENTDPEAVIIENDSCHLEPVFAARNNFYSTQGVITVLGYDGATLERYGRIQASLYGPDDLPDEILSEMKALGKKLYIAVWNKNLDGAPWLRSRFSEDSGNFEKVYGNSRVSLYELKEE